MVVRGLVDEDTAHAESGCFILLGPGGVSRDLGQDLVQGPMAVVDPDIADGVDIRVGVEAGDFTGVVGVGGGDVAWATVGVDNDQEIQRGIRLDSVWFKFNGEFLFPFSTLRLNLFSDLRCIQRGPGLRRQGIDVQRDNDR